MSESAEDRGDVGAPAGRLESLEERVAKLERENERLRRLRGEGGWIGASTLVVSRFVTSADLRFFAGKALELAYFVLGERDAALEAATQALARLPEAWRAQQKRSYRDVASPRKIAFGPSALLQILVLEATLAGEKRQEAEGELHPEDQALRFVKALVLASIRSSPFHLHVALSRVLHDFSLQQARKLWQELDGRLDRSERSFRKIKEKLLGEVSERFGDALSPETRPDRRVHFRCHEDAEPLRPTVEATLEACRPWSSLGSEIEESWRSDHRRSAASRKGLAQLRELLDPRGLAELAEAAGIEGPEGRLEIPLLASNGDRAGRHGGGRPGAALAESELDGIRRRLLRDAERRKGRTESFFGLGPALRPALLGLVLGLVSATLVLQIPRDRGGRVSAGIEANVPWFELRPVEVTRAAEGSALDGTVLELPGGSGSLLLVIRAPASGEAALTLDIVDGEGDPVASVSGLSPNRFGELTLTLPQESLPPGRYEAYLRQGADELSRYAFRVEAAR